MYNNPYRVSNKEVWGRWESNPNTSPEEKMYFRHFFDKFVNLALSRYEYDGLPDEIPPRMLNSYLLWQGMCPVSYTHLDVYKRQVYIKEVSS